VPAAAAAAAAVPAAFAVPAGLLHLLALVLQLLEAQQCCQQLLLRQLQQPRQQPTARQAQAVLLPQA
jgi:hypothetical protein